MNVFLFMPFGFLLPFTLKRGFFQTLLLGMVFSACIEAIQYFFSLGFCEFDDVFHNTLGTALGYGQWKLLSWFEARYGQRMNMCVQRIGQGVQVWRNYLSTKRKGTQEKEK